MAEASEPNVEQSRKLVDLFEKGNYHMILTSPIAKTLLDHDETDLIIPGSWYGYITNRLDEVLRKPSSSELSVANQYHIIGEASLYAFLQSNVTGPPLSFKSEEVIFTPEISQNANLLQQTRQNLIRSLSVDGEAAYSLIPNVELFVLARCILTHEKIVEGVDPAVGLWWKIHLHSLHQRLLSENTDTLQSLIFADISQLEDLVFSPMSGDAKEEKVRFLLERAVIYTTYGFDVKARDELDQASKETGFEFVLTGKLGKRTKFQDRDISQLVVLAKSGGSDGKGVDAMKATISNGEPVVEPNDPAPKPQNLDLNDDTLLESISFTNGSTRVTDGNSLPPALASLDPSSQPKLDPLDSIILLSWASSITNTSPQDGLTREETLPYATRVLDDGSSNWQIYTQALLVRSRIEGYRSRTVERSVLQLQALVDQIIAETTGTSSEQNVNTTQTGTFLPRPKESESAPVTERLRYIWALNTPTRWELEAELAARWVSVGGLRTALEIYERLEMWAEAALCWAATDREDKAREVVRAQLDKTPLPPDAPRLFCILGDIDKDPNQYIRAWEASSHRYARAQRSLGRHYVTQKDYAKAAAAYTASLKINRLNHSTWFALGCVHLELQDWPAAISSFTRVIQLNDTDAEAWSNLAAALIRLPSTAPPLPETLTILDDEDSPSSHPPKTQSNTHQALHALTRASRLKPTSFQIWDNLLTVSLSISPSPYPTLLNALRQIILLRSPSAGESAIPLSVLTELITHIITLDSPSSFLSRQLTNLVDNDIVPLITHSASLWRQVARLALWRNKSVSALEAYEKAWRAATARPGWETGTEMAWDEVVDATVELVDAYESLGPKERGEGLGAEEVVARDWRFKARSAVRGIMGKAKESFEDTPGWERLKNRLEDLRA
jgi:tetratricopeptide (TPR) repeat protein